MLETEASSGRESIISHCLQVRFDWQVDHWRHEFISVGQSCAIPRIWSIEQGHADHDPARVVSPTYQQIHVDRDPEQVRALLVGQSGPHHFSAAFTVRERPEGVEVDVDVADRCLVPFEALAATYLIEASGGHLIEGDTATITWKNPQTRLDFEADSPTVVAASESGMGHIRIQALAHLDLASHTHRFRYRWRWTNEPHQPIWDRIA